MKIADCTHLAIGDRKRKSTEYLMVHRGLWREGADEWRKYDIEPNARGVAKFYGLDLREDHKPPMSPPVTFTVAPSGMVEQLYLLSAQTVHAGELNDSALGIAVIGDPRHEPMPNEQWSGLVDIVAVLWRKYPDATLIGHTEAHEMGLRVTSTPGKICPGRFCDMHELAADATNINQDLVARDLYAAGVRL